MKRLMGAVLGVALVLSTSVQAAPTLTQGGLTTGTVDVDVVYQGQLALSLSAHENNNAELYLEKASYQLLSNLTPQQGSMIPAGTWVQSYILSFDPVGTSGSRREAIADITFDTQVLGLIHDTASASPHLVATDTTLGLAPTYTYGTGRELEAGSYPDSLSISGNMVSVHLFSTGGVDDVRIVTAAPVPAPGAILLAGLGTALVGWIRRRRSLS